MKLLICTQTVDANDSNLSFFLRWIEELSKHYEDVSVVCLHIGEHALPDNVHVYALGKGNKIARAWKFLRCVYALRKEYDRVFVHMNPEYIVLAGWYWRILGKKIVLWYTHKSVDIKLRIAALFAHSILTASKESFRLKSTKVHVVGHGIDTDFFSPDQGVVRGREVLAFGRLNQSKRHDVSITAMQWTDRDLWIAGEGPERADLETLAQKLQISSRVHFLGGRTQEQIRALCRRVGVMVHTSQTGSLDKVVLEALACGCPVVTTNTYFKDFPVTVAEFEPHALAVALENPHPADVEWVRQNHSLKNLIPKIVSYIS